MLKEIKGLHHVTSMASDAYINNQFFTKVLGLRRIKKTVNFDAPDVYHLYYGDEIGTPGSVMTYFPFHKMAKGVAGTGEVGTTVFSVPEGSLTFWQKRFADMNVKASDITEQLGEKRLEFSGPDGDGFALVEVTNDARTQWLSNGLSDQVAIYGFHSTAMRLQDSNSNRAQQGAGSVHHLAFAVENREAQLAVRKALIDTGYQVTPVIDRDYFWAIYFRTPGGVLFEIATNEPGFERDEDKAHLGETLKLPTQHEHLRETLEQHLQPLED